MCSSNERLMYGISRERASLSGMMDPAEISCPPPDEKSHATSVNGSAQKSAAGTQDVAKWITFRRHDKRCRGDYLPWDLQTL